MEGLSLLSPRSALAQALERERGRYNARVALARRQGRLDLERLALVLAGLVAPALEAVAAAAPGRVDAACEALFDLTLELLPLDVLGAEGRHPAVHAAWTELAPALGRLLAEAPRRVAAGLTNAALRLEAIPGVRPPEWLAALRGVAPLCPDAAALLACGQVLAWRAGAAHWRASALGVWEGLPEPLARATLGLPPDHPATRAALRAELADPFRRPGTAGASPALRLLGWVGGFRGFGGPFLAPPELRGDGARIWAVDGEESYTVHADCFGRTVVRAAGAPARSAATPGVRLEGDGALAVGPLRARIPALAGARAVAAAGGLVAVLPPHTHRVALVAAVTGEVA